MLEVLYFSKDHEFVFYCVMSIVGITKYLN